MAIGNVKITLILFLLTSLPFACAQKAQGQLVNPASMLADNFFSIMEGDWHGEAVETPIGPRPYDISFQRNASGLTGIANTGASMHSWTFFLEGHILKIRFHSTFRGNETPIFLTASDKQDSAIIFKAEHPDFLKVRIKPQKNETIIQIFLREKPHVKIILHKKNGVKGT